jgi:DNA invertase Pin-like site-specific DNA recombinase
MNKLTLDTLNIYRPSYIYIRCSTKKQNDISSNSVSLQTQNSLCNQFCQNKELQVTKVISEICSARKPDKQKKLYNFIKNNSNCNIIIYDVSRFSRNIIEGIKLLEKCLKNKITIYTVVEKIMFDDTTDIGYFTSFLIKTQAESDAISYRVKNTIEFKKSIGQFLTKPKYGFKIIKNDETNLVVDNEEEQIIIDIILKLKYGSLYENVIDNIENVTHEKEKVLIHEPDYNPNNIILYGHFTDSDIAFILNENNILYKNNQWKPSNIKNIIKNNNDIIKERNKKIDTIVCELYRLSKINNNIQKNILSNCILKQLYNLFEYDTNIVNIPISSIVNINSDIDVLKFLNTYNINYRKWYFEINNERILNKEKPEYVNKPTKTYIII